MKICLWHFLNLCKQCTPDVDPNHHPNNLDCVSYKPIGMGTMEVYGDEQPDSDEEVEAPPQA